MSGLYRTIGTGLSRKLNCEQLEDRTTPAVITVTNAADVPVVGLFNLREAITAANSPAKPGKDTINFAPGLYTNGNLTLDLIQGTLPTITEDLDIDGTSGVAGQRVKIQPANPPGQFRLLVIDTPAANLPFRVNVTLTNLTLTGGNATNPADPNGGGIAMYNATVILDNCVVEFNGAVGDGGGLYAMGSPSFLKLTNSAVLNNTAGGNGGGVSVTNTTLLMEKGTQVRHNTAGLGGGGIAAFANNYVRVGALPFVTLDGTNGRVQVNDNTANSGDGGGVLVRELVVGAVVPFVNFKHADVNGNTARGVASPAGQPWTSGGGVGWRWWGAVGGRGQRHERSRQLTVGPGRVARRLRRPSAGLRRLHRQRQRGQQQPTALTDPPRRPGSPRPAGFSLHRHRCPMPRLVLLVLLAVFALALPAPAADKEKKEVDPVRKKAAAKRFAKLKDYLTERRVTHVVEVLAEWREFADENQQDDVLGWVADLRKTEDGVAAALGKTAFEIGYRGVKATAKVGEYPSAFFLEDFSSGQPPKKRLSSDPFAQTLIVASKTLVPWTNISTMKCVILTNAEVAEFHGIDDCLVISSGSLHVTNKIHGSAVVCRGNVEVTLDYPPHGGTMWAGGTVTDLYPKTEGRGKPAEMGAVEKDDKLQGMKFYSTAEDGLSATAEKGVVMVSKVDEKKPFAKAGVKKGDVIESVNGEKVPSLHELDRLVCRATVASGVAKVAVKRGDKAEVIEVKLADW